MRPRPVPRRPRRPRRPPRPPDVWAGGGRQRVRATREVGGYIETFTGTTGPDNSTYRRSFREARRAGNKRRY